jgi:hypothetical protein
MINTPVKVEYKFHKKDRRDFHTDTWMVEVYEKAYRDDGTMYPKLVDIKEYPGKLRARKLLQDYISYNYSNVVVELDETPLFVQEELF